MRISDWSSDVCSSDLITPSRDSHEVRHCENARHARSGLPRWPSEISRPIVDSTSPSSSAASCTPTSADGRSEEHTSGLQSLMRNSYAGFCLKKKTAQVRGEEPGAEKGRAQTRTPD